MTQAWFFAHLGLEATEDIGAIRRAYAVALKRIDQAREPAAFERLRDAYQRALDWARNPDSRDEDEAETEYWEAAEEPLADEPPAPVVTPTTPVGISHAAPNPGVDLAAEAERRDAAIADRIARLLSAAAADLPAEFDAALADPDLGHLDARQQFETGLLEALHEDPAGRLALFELAAERLDWRRDHAKLAYDWMANGWADRALDQADHFAALPRIVRRRHDYLLRRVARRPQPGLLWLWNDGAILASLQEEYPDWLELRLPPGRFAAWAAARAALSPRWERVGRFIDPRRMTTGRLIGIILVAAILISFGKGWREATRETAPVDTADTTVAIDAPADGLNHALAYEFSGINDAEGCGMVADFAAGSNWLEVPDDLARALLVTRILDCRMRGWWPAGQEALAACLRGARLSALNANRAEDFGPCATAP